MIINVTSDVERKNVTFNLQNLTEYTFYNVSIAAESEVAISRFAKEITILTLCKLNPSHNIVFRANET